MGTLSNVQIERRKDYLWIIMPDNLNSNNYLHIEKQIAGRFDEDKLNVVIDFNETKHIYSAAIGVIIRLREHVVRNNGKMWLVNVSNKCRESFVAVNLNKVIHIYTNELDFELAQANHWEERISPEPSSFLYLHYVENAICRIKISGKLVGAQGFHFSATPLYEEKVLYYLFDFTDLRMVDSHGAYVLLNIVLELRKHDSICYAYGGRESVKELLELLGIDEYLPCYETEQLVLEAVKDRGESPIAFAE